MSYFLFHHVICRTFAPPFTLFGLEWENVDLIGRTITVPVENSKSKRERQIPINESLTRLFKEIKKVTFKDDAYVFTGRKQLKSIKNGCKKIEGCSNKLISPRSSVGRAQHS